MINLPKSLTTDPDFRRLKSYIISVTGLSYFQAKEEDLSQRLLKRFEAIGVNDCGSYLTRLGGSSGAGGELDLLVNELTIGETYFFRHSEQFDALRTVIIPALIKKNEATKRLSIWCAGCSTGAEPYSISILLRREFKHLLRGWMIDIIGTDINRSFLSRASEGRFDDWHLRATSEELKVLCFQRSERSWLINAEYREGVSFLYHNLITGQYPPRYEGPMVYDIILCRNVMIYFSHETIAGILPQFDRCLGEEGWMLLGYSEINTDLYRAFDLVPYPGAIIFQKRKTKAIPEPLWPANPKKFPSLSQSQAPELPSHTRSIFDLSPAPSSSSGTVFVPPLPPVSSLGSIPSAAATVAPSIKNFTVDSETPYRQCRALADQGDFKGAMTIANELLMKEQLDPRAHFLRALTLVQLEQYADAEEAFRKTIYLDRKFILAHYHMALLYRKLGQGDKAKRFFANANDLLQGLDRNGELLEGNGMTVVQLAHSLKSYGGAA
jgi:chemotaxis protein methyltransferase CheR